ncbi:MAG TPA: glucokinase [Lysobacter sp.]
MNNAAALARRAGTRVLVSDIGGTNARFGIAETGLRGALVDGSVREFPVAGFPSLSEAAATYLDMQHEQVDAAVFAVAGRILGDEVRITNHPWVISREQTQRALGVAHVALLNDFAAQAMAITCLQDADVVAIGPQAWRAFDPRLPRTYAVIGPGTGLGVGGLMVRNGKCYPLETEGGHAGFAPVTVEDLRLLECLIGRFGRVSCERLVSGPGLVNLHSAVCEISGQPQEALEPSAITARAAAGDGNCQRAIDVFCAAFGSMAGDLVLMHGAWDGVFLAGGLVPKMLPALQASSFRERFESKGRFSSALADVPSLAIVHPNSGLLGAAAHAAELFHSPGG